MPNNRLSLHKSIFLFCFLIIGLISCKKEKNYPPYKVLILGNSITYAPADPSIGWNGSWGMAASAADKDYVHLLTARFTALNKASVVKIKNIAEFEADFDTYDLNQLQSLRDEKPDIIILRIGENVTRVADAALFEQKYVDLIAYLKINNPEVKILAVGSVWSNRDLPNTVMSKYSPYVSLNSVESGPSYLSFDLYTDPGIKLHPSDKGMAAITDIIWNALKNLLQIA